MSGPLRNIAGDDFGAKEAVARLIEKINFAAADNEFLSAGGRRQQPASLIDNKTLSIKEAERILETLRGAKRSRTRR